MIFTSVWCARLGGGSGPGPGRGGAGWLGYGRVHSAIRMVLVTLWPSLLLGRRETNIVEKESNLGGVGGFS
jgi:hypothetical protein